MCFLLSALDVKGEDRGTAVREVRLVQRMLGMLRKRGVVDLFNQGMCCQELDNFLCVFSMPLQPQRQRLDALQQQEGIEWGDRRPGIAEENRPDIGGKSSGAGSVGKRDPVVAGVGRSDGSVFAACLPVEGAAVDDDAAEGGPVAAEELGGGMNDDVGAVLDGADQIGRAERIVDDERDLMAVCDLRKRIDIRDVAVGVAEGLDEEGLCVRLDGGLHLGEVMDVHKGGVDAEGGQCVGQQIVAAAVDGLLGDDVFAFLGERFDGVSNRRRSGGNCQRGHAAFERSDSLLQDILRGVGQPAVNVARVGKPEPGCRMGGVVKYIRRRLVDGDSACVCCRIRLFLTDMKLKSFKFV